MGQSHRTVHYLQSTMRRSHSVRKVVYALIVLAVFMVILRVSRPGNAGPISIIDKDDSKIVYHDADTLVNKEETRVSAPSLEKPKEEPKHQESASQPSAAAAKKEGTSSETKDSEVREELTYDAASAYNHIVNDPSSPPVIIFSKSYCPHSMRAKNLLLEAYTIQPAPKVVELDLVPHGAELQAYITEKTGRRTVPNILVNGISRGGASDLVELEDGLLAKFIDWGQGKLSIKKEEAVVQERN